MNPEMLLSFLRDNGIIDELQMTDLLDEQSRTGKPIEEVVANSGVIRLTDMYQMIAHGAGHRGRRRHRRWNFRPSCSASSRRRRRGSRASCRSISTARSCAWRWSIRSTRTWSTIFASPRRRTSRFTSRPRAQIQAMIERFYGSEVSDMEDVLASLAGEPPPRPSHGDVIDIEGASSAPIVKYVNTVLAQAIQARASDIHFEPFEHEFKIRYRVDGALYEMSPPPRSLATAITSRIKVMSNLNIAERRIPQDGRIQTTMAGPPGRLARLHAADAVRRERRAARAGPHHREARSRRHRHAAAHLRLHLRGHRKAQRHLHRHRARPAPARRRRFTPASTGSTPTDAKLLTAEEPVEYEIEGIQQVPINEAIGLTFARALRAFLRQDPDRIMVGETRDLETAQIAIQASLTGHLVFTTLHTNDAPGAVARLIDMGVEPFLIASSLEGVLGQRLVRKICTDCRTPYEPSEAILRQIGLSVHDIGDKNFYYGTGCDQCNHTGYKGRKGIYELLDITEPIRELITQRAPSVVIRQKAIELGMTTLRADGLRSIFEGETTIEEVLKYT